MSARRSRITLRHSARTVVLDEHHRILLCRHVVPELTGAVAVRAAPGGGAEPGETVLAALRREPREEAGLTLDAAPPHGWHQEVAGSAARRAARASSTTDSWSAPCRSAPAVR
ncbi:NUDIX domain-containing protein [Kitasatospora griseola]|uniref:NUDIX domain-containing protein n=1 Tax=Kitasatospora griseola TaxID=2064 RepID=UPI001E4D1351|nr:NUDIX domain-containing protein [Kitasatospora griseola]